MWLLDGERVEVFARDTGEFCAVVRELLERGLVRPYYSFYWVSNEGIKEVPLRSVLTGDGWVVEVEGEL